MVRRGGEAEKGGGGGVVHTLIACSMHLAMISIGKKGIILYFSVLESRVCILGVRDNYWDVGKCEERMFMGPARVRWVF